MNESATYQKARQATRAALCMFMALVLAIGLTPLAPVAPRAYAANDDKPSSVVMTISGKSEKPDVMKQVITLDVGMDKNTAISFDVNDNYKGQSNDSKKRKLVFEDANGKQTVLSEGGGNTCSIKASQLVTGQKLKLITSTKDKSGNFVQRYETQLNVRVIDAKKSEQKPSSATAGSAAAGISEDGTTWSFSNGLEVKLANTGFKFLDNTTINLGGMALPLKYKHEANGTTIVGINCDPNNVAFYKAVKNGNVWQKYTTEKMAEMTKQMDKGWSGKGFGKWGGKAFDWNVMGFMEYNTKDPAAPRAVNLIISMGMKAEGHAQYLCFTGTLTFNIGGKATLVGKLIPTQGIEGKFNLGAYAGLELYIGLGLNYVASVGAYGKGQINIDFQVLPKFYLDTIKLSGEMGAKAKLFGFTIFSWTILKGEKPLYNHPKDTKSAPALNADGTATSPFTVDADTAYPLSSSTYLTGNNALAAGQSDSLSAQATANSKTILEGIYDQTELSCATTDSGPVIAYVADARQIDPSSQRTDANRSVVVYKRMLSDGTWSPARIIETGSEYADFSPTIHAVGDTCYVTWLDAKEGIKPGESIGQVGQKLDVKVATITKGSDITQDGIVVETVFNESVQSGTVPANPKAIKVGDDVYVGWYTNQSTGSQGEVIGLAGAHNIRLFKKNGDKWEQVQAVTTGQTGAITSFDVGNFGGKAACVWSLDEDFANKYSSSEKAKDEGITLNGVQSLESSTVYALTSDSNTAHIVAMKATNAQFAKKSGADVLTYAIRVGQEDAGIGPFLYVYSSSGIGQGASVALDGSKVNLPTPYYEITGDLGQNRQGNISFLKAGDGTCDIQALVTTGQSSSDWTTICEATADTATITDYCATYDPANMPLFIYTTQRESAADGSAIGPQDDSSDSDAVDMHQSTDASLKHLSVTDIDYDEYEVTSGQNMPITVYFENDGMLDVTGYDLYKLENGSVEKVASAANGVKMDEEGQISFTYTIPDKSAFTKAREFTLYVAPQGTAVNAAKIGRELADQSAMTVSFGDASLSLEVQHQLVDGQESVSATVTNDGIVPHAATLVFLDSNTGDTLTTMDVPELGEGETFTWTYDAPNGYFENDGVKNMTITLENDGTEAAGYEINNTEFVSTWELNPQPDETPVTPKPAPAKAAAPKTGDQISLMLILALIAIALIAAPATIRTVRKMRD